MIADLCRAWTSFRSTGPPSISMSRLGRPGQVVQNQCFSVRSIVKGNWMRKDIAHPLLLGISTVLMLTLPVFMGNEASAQSSRTIACEQTFDACNDACVRQGVITARCFNRCKRSNSLCAIRQLVLPSVRSREPAGSQAPAAMHNAQ